MTRRKARTVVALASLPVLVTFAASAADTGLPAPKNDAPKEQHLFGDWGGLRTDLETRGIELSLDYIGESAAVVSGGKQAGADYAQQLQFKFDLDWKMLAGIEGLTTHAALINRAGRNASTDYVGDNLFQVQDIYGGAGDVLAHLVYFYGEQKFLGGRVDLAAGRLPVGNDFATSPLYCDFMNTGICGYPHSLPAKVGFTAYPNSTWGGRLRVDPGARIYIQAGLYQVRPQFGGRSGFDWGSSGTTGAYIPVELGYEPVFGTDELPGHYKVGATHDTSEYPDLHDDAAGQPFALSGNPPREHDGRGSVYLLADQMIARNGNGPMNGVIVFGGVVHSSPATSQFEMFAFGGLLDQGIISSRPGDSAGISVAYAKIGNPLIETEIIQAALGQPLAMDAEGIQSNEIILESRYDFKVVDGLHVMPDIQYVIRPGAATRYPDATVLALHVAVDF